MSAPLAAAPAATESDDGEGENVGGFAGGDVPLPVEVGRGEQGQLVLPLLLLALLSKLAKAYGWIGLWALGLFSLSAEGKGEGANNLMGT